MCVWESLRFFTELLLQFLGPVSMVSIDQQDDNDQDHDQSSSCSSDDDQQLVVEGRVSLRAP